MTPAYGHLAVTDRRVFYVARRGLIARSFHQIPAEALLTAGIEEGLLSATIVIHARGKVGEEYGDHELRFPGVAKAEAAEFVSALSYLRTQISPEVDAYQTKRCPNCDEMVKKRARVCRFCGFKFM
jgi:hypothetical protein